MNPSVQRIQTLFHQNNPNDYYWKNFKGFLQGHSYKAVEKLLSHPWGMYERMTMLALMNGMDMDQWVVTLPIDQCKYVLQKVSVSRTTQFGDAPVPYLASKYAVVEHSWGQVSNYDKMRHWASWCNTMSNSSVDAHRFWLKRMDEWQTQTPSEQLLKILAFVNVFDSLSTYQGLRFNDHLDIPQQYMDMCHEAVKGMHGLWPQSIESVHTWRQLQGYPQLLEHVGSPHPWMETLTVLYTGPLISSIPPAVSFNLNGPYLRTEKHPRLPRVNPLNPLDSSLARAFQRNLLREPVNLIPEIQGLFALLEDSPMAVQTLLHMQSAPAPIDNVDAGLFDFDM